MLNILLSHTTKEVFYKVFLQLLQLRNFKRTRFPKSTITTTTTTTTAVNVRNMQRTWINFKQADKGISSCSSCNSSVQQKEQEQQSYKLMSYNILAQDLLLEHCNLYTGIDLQYLCWKKRLLCLRNEICEVQPDILCLQEMQYNHLHELMQNIRKKRKLAYVYKKKTNTRTDGCAIIYDSDKFNLLAEEPVEYFNKPQNANLNRGNVAIMAKFNVRSQPDKQFIVATTHLLFNPKRENIRVAQVQILVDALKKFSENNIPILLTGDFNSQPHTAAYETLINPKSGLYLMPVNFGTRAVSTFQDSWILVDHILYTPGTSNYKHNICICGVLLLPTLEQCSCLHRTPNQYIGSDHFSLLMSFSIK